MTLPAHLQHPDSCSGCPLDKIGRGFVRPSGPPAARVLLVGESAGAKEAETGVPFAGPAGGKLGHILYRLSRDRAAIRVSNLCWCQPPGDKLEGAYYQHAAMAQCRGNLQPVLEEGHLVVVPLGAVPARELLGLPDAGIKDLHGTVTKTTYGGKPAWIVPTFHPSHLIRGAHNLTGTVTFDLNRAFEIADAGGWEEAHPTLHCDPSPEFFEHWVRGYLQELAAEPLHTWLSVDVETPDKEREQDEGELKSVDRSMQIIRINFSYNPEIGLTVPFVEPYISIMRPMLEAVGATQCYWNKAYDLKRLRPIFKFAGHQLDFMDAWKALHSDTPRGLGFVAPFYGFPTPWKHTSGFDPVTYAAMDSVQTQRCAFGIAADLSKLGMWDVFWRHMHEFGVYATTPSCEIGLKIDRKALEGWTDEAGKKHPGMREQMAGKSRELYDEMQGLVADELKPLHPKGGWTRRPEGETYEAEGRPRFIIEKAERKAVKLCGTCGTKQISAKHRCKDKSLQPAVTTEFAEVPRWYIRLDFNPASPVQVLAYIKASGHTPGREKGKETTNRETIERLADAKARSKKDERARDLYHNLLDYRDIKKVLGTYVEGTLRRLAIDREAGITDDRLHPTVTNNPSTLRTAMSDPNLQNVVADRRGAESLSAGFRRAVVAEAGAKLVELDWSSIEAVIAGWCMGDPDYIRASWTGIHDHVVGAVVGRPVPKGASIDVMMAHLTALKEEHEKSGLRDQIKRVSHGSSYGLTPFGMAKRFRKIFPSVEIAEKLQKQFYSFAVKMQPWQQTMQDLAYKQEYIGGPGAHPFGYRHEFYNVRNFAPVTDAQAVRLKRLGKSISYMNGRWYEIQQGEDAKRAIAFFPQSIAAGIIRETALLLFKPGESEWYIGDTFHGRTPLRAIIHDSFLLEIPDAQIDEVIRKVAACMTRAIPQLPLPAAWGLGPYLQFGVAVKVGQTWAETKKVKVPQPWLDLLKNAAGAGELGLGVEEDAVMDEDLGDDPVDEPAAVWV